MSDSLRSVSRLPVSAPSAASWRVTLPTACPGLTLACAAVRDRAKAQAWLDAEGIVCPLVELREFPAMPIWRSNARPAR